MLDTDQLRSFVAIVDTGSFTRAAERVNKTQSSISMHIRRLEERLSCSLFSKQGRGVRLSEEGEKLVEYARRILSLEAAALSAVGRASLAGRVKFGIPDDYAEPFLPRILNALSRTHPRIELTVTCDGSLSLADRIAAREIDVALVTDTGAFGGVEVIRHEALLWAAGPAFALETSDPVPLALGSPSCWWRQVAEETLSAAAIPFKTVLVSNNFSAIAPMVMAGAAITVLPASTMRSGMRSVGSLYGLPSLPNTRYGLIRSPGEPSAASKALGDAIRVSLSPEADSQVERVRTRVVGTGANQ
jgi:DNA-binding transcriptional LysR family regulator